MSDKLKTMCTTIPQESEPKKLREMVTYVPDDENGNKLEREMVSIIEDNTKPRVMCTTDMVHVVEKSKPDLPILYNPQIAITKNMHDTLFIASSYADSNTYRFESGIMFYNDIPFINCCVEIVETIYSETCDFYHCRINMDGKCIYKKIKTTDFSSGKWLLGVAGIALVGPRGTATQCLHLYLDFLVLTLDLTKSTHQYFKPGWHIIDNKYYYVTPQGIIDGQFFKANSERGQKFDSLEIDFSSFSQYLNATNVTSSNVATILVLHTAMSLCNTLFRAANFTPRFSLFVYGYRGNYKTSISLALSQISYKDTPSFSLKGTAAGIESGFRDYRDATILVDDLCPSAVDQKKMYSNIEAILRAFGDGTAHRRCTLQYSDEKANKIGQYEAEGGCIFTGELTNIGCDSSLARCLFVELKKEHVNLELLSSIQDDRHLVERFAVCFISCLTRLINDYGVDVIKFIETRGKEIRKNRSFKYSNERFGEYVSQLQTTSELLMFVANYFNLLGNQEISIYSEKFSAAILDVVAKNDTRLVAQNPTTVLCNALKSAIEDEKISYCVLGSVVPNYDNVAFHKDDYLYITQKCYAKIANDYIKEYDLNLAEFTAARVATTLENSHIISIVMEGATKRMASKLPGYGSKRFMKISMQEFNKHVSI